MINTERIVPVTAIDLLSLYGLIVKTSGTTITKIDAADVEGDFVISANPANAVIASQPVKSLDFASPTSAAVVYFVPAYDFAGFKLAGAAQATTGDDVVNDGRSLYTATLSSGTITIAKVSF